ncbi:MAG: hypothetical protein AMXMBFR64_31320 [Myxococcales bacterium]
MTRTLLDLFAKAITQALLDPFGDLTFEEEVVAPARRADIVFRPRPERPAVATDLLAGLLAGPTLIEHCSRGLDVAAVRRALAVASVLGERRGEAAWAAVLVAPAVPASLGRAFGATAECPGVFRLAPALGMLWIAANALPRTPESLGLRLLGSGRVRREAVLELRGRAAGDPLREAVAAFATERGSKARHLVGSLSPEEETLMAHVSPEFLEWKRAFAAEAEARGRTLGHEAGVRDGMQAGVQAGMQAGMQAGKAEEARAAALRLLRRRFGDAAFVAEPALDLVSALSDPTDAVELAFDAVSPAEFAERLAAMARKPAV